MTDQTSDRDDAARTRSLLAVAVAALAVCWFALTNPVVTALLARIALPLLAAIGIAAAAAGLARLLGGVNDAEPRWMALSRDVILGVPLLGTLFFIAGLISTKLTLIFPLLAIAGALLLWRTRSVPTPPASARTPFEIVFLALAAIALLQSFAVAQLPAFSLDEVAYHLTVIKTWVLEGRVVELPLLSHSYFPFGVEAASLPLISLLGNDGAVAAHFLNLFIAIATTAFAFRCVEMRAGRTAAAVAATAIMGTPAMLITAGWAWNDWPLLGAVLVLLDAVDRDEPHTRNIALAVAAGLLTKYTFVVPAGAILAVAFAFTGARGRIVRGAAIGAVAGSVFFLRNLILTGNPVAPLLGPLSPKVSHFRSGEGLLGTLRGYVLEPGIADEALGITLLLLAICGLLFATRAMSRTTQLLAAASTSTVVLLAMMPSSRILVPSLACAALAGAVLTFHRATVRMQQLVAALVFVAAGLQMSIAVFYFDTLAPFGVMSSQLSIESFLMKQGPYAEAKWANDRLPADSKTLVIGLNSLFWFERPARGGGNFDGPRMNAYLESADAAALHQRMREEGFTHVAIFDRGLLTNDELHRERATHLSPAAFRHLGTLVNGFATAVAEEGNRHLFKLR